MASIIGVETLQHTNGTTAATIDSSGVVSQPNIPCAKVTLTTSNADDTTNPYDPATDTVIRWDKVDVNQGSCYSSSTGRFTATKAGIWELNTSVLTGNGTGTAFDLKFFKNGSALNEGIYSSVDTEYRQVSGTHLFDLSVNDYIEIKYIGGEVYIHDSVHFNSVTWKFIG